MSTEYYCTLFVYAMQFFRCKIDMLSIFNYIDIYFRILEKENNYCFDQKILNNTIFHNILPKMS